jgi:hypothetical protein
MNEREIIRRMGLLGPPSDSDSEDDDDSEGGSVPWRGEMDWEAESEE